jgi:hypothetical protein
MKDVNYSTFLTHGDIIEGNLPKLSSFRHLEWKYIYKIKHDFIGITFLTENKSCLGIVSINCGIKPIENNRFIIWERGTTKIDLYDTSDLRPIKNEIELSKKINDSSRKYFFNANPIDSIDYSFEKAQPIIEIGFPDSFKSTNEIIQMNTLDGFYSENKEGFYNDILVILRPNESRIYFYPQDWYNKDLSFDHGYSWLPRAERNTNTGKIHIDGVRMKSPLILDVTNKQLENNLD